MEYTSNISAARHRQMLNGKICSGGMANLKSFCTPQRCKYEPLEQSLQVQREDTSGSRGKVIGGLLVKMNRYTVLPILSKKFVGDFKVKHEFVRNLSVFLGSGRLEKHAYTQIEVIRI